MKHYPNFVTLAAVLVVASGLVYLIHYWYFEDLNHILIFLGSDLGFVFLEVLLVVLVIERILAHREKQTMLNKLNMVIGAFFSEVGTHLLGKLVCGVEKREEISQHLTVSSDWSHADFKKAMAVARTIKGKPDCADIDLSELRTFLSQKRSFLLRLLENPNVLEHERFSDLLWAVFHLDEELEARASLANIPRSDLAHIAVDIQRVCGHLAAEWIAHVEHLKLQYPYLFSLVVRTNPFRERPSAVVT